MRMFWSLLLVVGIAGVASCNKDTKTTVTPDGRGERGESCQARNDCGGGLACVNGICSKNDFEISVNAKHCDRVECEEDEDCCGDRPRQAPSKCNNRTSVCLTPTVDDCYTTTCTSDSECGEGACGPGTCTITGTCTQYRVGTNRREFSRLPLPALRWPLARRTSRPAAGGRKRTRP